MYVLARLPNQHCLPVPVKQLLKLMFQCPFLVPVTGRVVSHGVCKLCWSKHICHRAVLHDARVRLHQVFIQHCAACLSSLSLAGLLSAKEYIMQPLARMPRRTSDRASSSITQPRHARTFDGIEEMPDFVNKVNEFVHRLPEGPKKYNKLVIADKMLWLGWLVPGLISWLQVEHVACEGCINSSHHSRAWSWGCWQTASLQVGLR